MGILLPYGGRRFIYSLPSPLSFSIIPCADRLMLFTVGYRLVLFTSFLSTTFLLISFALYPFVGGRLGVGLTSDLGEVSDRLVVFGRGD